MRILFSERGSEKNMLAGIKKEDSIFLVNQKTFERFLQLEQQLHNVALVIPFEQYKLTKVQLALDIWALLTTNSTALLEHSENRMIFMIRAFLLEELKADSNFKRLRVECEKNDRLAFFAMIYMIADISKYLDICLEEHQVLDTRLKQISEYQHRDLASLFDSSYQAIEAYPKEFVLTQRNVIDALQQVYQAPQVTQLIRQAIVQAREIYQVIYTAEENA